MKIEWDDEETETNRAICAQESLEVAGVLTTARGAAIGCGLTTGEAATEPLAVVLAPQGESVAPHPEAEGVPAWVSEVEPQLAPASALVTADCSTHDSEVGVSPLAGGDAGTPLGACVDVRWESRWPPRPAAPPRPGPPRPPRPPLPPRYSPLSRAGAESLVGAEDFLSFLRVTAPHCSA